MSNEVARIVAEMAIEEQLGLPCAGPEDDRRQVVEAAGFNWLQILKWLAENRDQIKTLVEGAIALVKTFPRPPQASETEPEAIDPATIVMLVTALAPLIAKLLERFGNRLQPAPQPGPQTV